MKMYARLQSVVVIYNTVFQYVKFVQDFKHGSTIEDGACSGCSKSDTPELVQKSMH